MSVALGLATLGVQCTSNRAVAMATLGLFCIPLEQPVFLITDEHSALSFSPVYYVTIQPDLDSVFLME